MGTTFALGGIGALLFQLLVLIFLKINFSPVVMAEFDFKNVFEFTSKSFYVMLLNKKEINFSDPLSSSLYGHFCPSVWTVKHEHFGLS